MIVFALIVSMITFGASASTKTEIENYLNQGNTNKAIDTINQKLTDSSLVNEQKAVLYYYKGQAFMQQGSKDKAKQAFDQASELDNAHLFNNTVKFHSFKDRAESTVNTNSSIYPTTAKTDTSFKKTEESSSNWIWWLLGLTVVGVGGYFGWKWMSNKMTNNAENKDLIEKAKQNQNALSHIVADLVNVVDRYKNLAVDLKIRDKSLDDLNPLVKDEQATATEKLKDMIKLKDEWDVIVANNTCSSEEYDTVYAKMPDNIESVMNQLFNNLEAVEFALNNNCNLNQ